MSRVKQKTLSGPPSQQPCEGGSNSAPPFTSNTVASLFNCCHTFRATGITTYLENGGTLEHAQTIANHESPRNTKLYDRTREQLSAEEISRIRI